MPKNALDTSLWISTNFIKDYTPVIAIHLANIISLSIKLDTLPSKCKIAKTYSLLKKRIQIEAKKYRPISLLPLISKTIEKSILDQIHDYLQRNKLPIMFVLAK